MLIEDAAMEYGVSQGAQNVGSKGDESAQLICENPATALNREFRVKVFWTRRYGFSHPG